MIFVRLDPGLSEADAQTRRRPKGTMSCRSGSAQPPLRIILEVVRAANVGAVARRRRNLSRARDLTEALILDRLATLSVLITAGAEDPHRARAGGTARSHRPRALVVRNGERKRSLVGRR